MVRAIAGYCGKMTHAIESLLANVTEHIRIHGDNAKLKDAIRSLRETFTVAAKEALQMLDSGESGALFYRTAARGAICLMEVLPDILTALGVAVKPEALVQCIRQWTQWSTRAAETSVITDPSLLMAQTHAEFLSLHGTVRSHLATVKDAAFKVINDRILQCFASIAALLLKLSGCASDYAKLGFADELSTTRIPPQFEETDTTQFYVNPSVVQSDLQERCSAFMALQSAAANIPQGFPPQSPAVITLSPARPYNNQPALDTPSFHVLSRVDDELASSTVVHDRAFYLSVIHTADHRAVEYYTEWQRCIADRVVRDKRLSDVEDKAKRLAEQLTEKDRTMYDLIQGYSKQIGVLSDRVVELESIKATPPPKTPRGK
jgi:hypothetical protein